MAQQSEPIVLDPKDPRQLNLALKSLRQLRTERGLRKGEPLNVGIADETIVNGRRIMVGPFVRRWAWMIEHRAGDPEARRKLERLGITEDSGQHRKDTPHSMPVEIAITEGGPRARRRHAHSLGER